MNALSDMLEFWVSIPFRFLVLLTGDWRWAFSEDFFGKGEDEADARDKAKQKEQAP
jgi:hypothetical protein